jgi:DNA-binding transcriptional ArsR family regulator
MTRYRSVLTPLLRSETQARILAALLLRPDREASIADLAREAGADPRNAHDEVIRLLEAGLLTDRRVGRSRLVKATQSPVNRALANLLVLGYGPKPAAEAALRGMRGVEKAFIVGSWAARYTGQPGVFPHDIDVVVIGTPDRDEVSDAIVDAIRAVGQDAQVIFRTQQAWDAAQDPFTKTAKSGPIVELDLGP